MFISQSSIDAIYVLLPPPTYFACLLHVIAVQVDLVSFSGSSPAFWLHHWKETGNERQEIDCGRTIFRHVWSCTCLLQRRKSRSRSLGTRRTPMTGGGEEGKGEKREWRGGGGERERRGR